MARDKNILVGDVGGTHARFAIIDVSRPAPWRIEHRMDLEQEFPTFNTALRTYIERGRVLSVPAAAVVVLQEDADRPRLRRQAERAGLHGLFRQTDRRIAQEFDVLGTDHALGSRRYRDSEMWRVHSVKGH